FTGRQLHTVDYDSPDMFAGRRVVVVGGGNSAAQILAEVSTVAETLWVTRRPPLFMPDEVDGRVLFDVATAREAARRSGRDHDGVAGLGDIVMVPPVQAARDHGVLDRSPMFDRISPTAGSWNAGREHECDAISWCTGFRAHLGHLRGLGVPRENGHPATDGTPSIDPPGLELIGNGD